MMTVRVELTATGVGLGHDVLDECGATGVSNFAQLPSASTRKIVFCFKPEERPIRTNWEVVKSSLWTGAGGVVVGMLLLSYGFGFMSRTTAEKLASTSSERAVIAVLAPVCAANFRALPDVATRTATLVANKDSYKM